MISLLLPDRPGIDHTTVDRPSYPGLVREVQRARGLGVPAEGAEADGLNKVGVAIGVAFDEVYFAREAWHVASRSGLGVPS